jgi:hypothetical protein
MAEMVVLLVLIGLVVYGVERNNARHRYPRSRLSGSATAIDRDAERMSAELAVTGAHEPVVAHRAARVGGVATRIPSVR